MRKKFIIPFVLACLMFSACAEHYEDVEPEVAHSDVDGVTLSAEELRLAVGASSLLNATVFGADMEVRWINSDPATVSMVATGNTAAITAKANGISYVTAIAGLHSAQCKVTVGGGSDSGVVTVNSITIEPTTKTITEGENFNLNTVVDATGGSVPVTFSSSNELVATVTKQSNASALVSGVSAGTATITAMAGSKSATCAVTVEAKDEAFSIRLNRTTATIEAGKTEQLTATVNPSDLIVNWQSNNTDVAEVDQKGLITAKATGSATITATVTFKGESKTAQCHVGVVAGGDDDYEASLTTWSQPGHLYMHYLRSSDSNYNQWAVWIWQNYPIDSAGSLWGANLSYDLKGITPATLGWMTNAETGGTGNDMHVDEYGAIIDIDLTKEDLVDGRTGKLSPLVSDWTDISKNALGFLIVDQSKMTGDDMWVSDGGAETYIRRLGRLMPDGKDSYLHVYCVEGAVSEYTTASGKQVVVNPTLNDKDKLYRSQNDIEDLKHDDYPNGVSTSTTFLEDKPGVGYQIFVPSFADSDGDGFGDINGINDKLDYLQDLGVEVLWLTPIQESNSYHGYDVTDYYKIDPKFGTMEDYQRLIYNAHQRGMKVLMDMVINHTSKSNVLYKKSQKAEEGEFNGDKIKYRDMYLWKYEGDQILEWDGVEAGATAYGPDNPATFISKNVETSSDWYRDGTSNYFYYGKFGSGMAELNYSSKATRQYMTDMCKYWLSFGLDGFRLDAIKHIYLLSELDPGYNTSGDFISYDVSYRTYFNVEMQKEVTVQNDYTYDRDLNVMFWKQFAGNIKSAYPNCFLVGENFDGWDARIAPFYEAMDSEFDFSTYYHLNEVKPESIGSSVQKSLNGTGGNGWQEKGYYSYRSNGINGAFTSNHDVARMMNHAAGHDASINSKYSGGDGIHHTEVTAANHQYALNMARYYAAVSILTPGVSWIYYGDEIGLTGNVNDKVPDSTGTIYDDHGNNVDRWYRQPMKWGDTLGEDNVVKYQFGGVEVLWDSISQNIDNVSEQLNDPNSLLNHFKLLTKIKNDDRYPTYGRLTGNGSINGDPSGSYFQITDGIHTVRVRINNSDKDVYLQLPDGGTFMGGSAGATNQKIPAYGFHVIIA